MRIKKACQITGLTERAVRLYVARQLLTPKQTNGLLDFSKEDITRLRDIALLRQFDFSLEQISNMLRKPEAIPENLRLRKEDALLDQGHSQTVHTTLAKLEGKPYSDFHEFAQALREQASVLPLPDFGRFDGLSPEERTQQKESALHHLEQEERRRSRFRKLRWIFGIGAAVLLLAAFCLTRPRVQGFIPFGPFTITALSSETMTVAISDNQIRETFGVDSITVPFHAHGVPLSVGDTLDGGCQLAFELSNFDLLRIGIHPWQTLRTRSEEVNRAWMRHVIQSLFRHEYGGCVALWIREYNPAQFPQLLLWE